MKTLKKNAEGKKSINKIVPDEKKLLHKQKKKNSLFPIIAIGASSGGIEALTEMLQHLSSNAGMAYVYIQHLDATHESRLVSILSKKTKMKVEEAVDKMEVEINHFYIIPPNKEMIIENNHLRLMPRNKKAALHQPINIFFHSLAENHKERGIGIVLSGNAADGALGLKSIKIAGGMTFAQDDSAKFQSMPKNAIAEGGVDLILSPKEIAQELERLGNHITILRNSIFGQEEIGDEYENEHYNNIILLLKKTTSVDFTHYKKSTMRRRIIRRMLLYKLNDLKEYLKYLRQHTYEINTLYQDLLINVTAFFRDPEAIDFIKKRLLQKILRDKSASDPLRIWVPACSTGEEAYSLAMVIMEVLGEKAISIPVQIFATDLSERAITKARMGIYSKADLANISPKRIQSFFNKVDGSYRIVKPLRDMCIFAPHNIFKDPPFSRIDILSCCNLLIYLDSVLQKKVVATFHYALNSNGFLVLGKSESLGTSANLFSHLDKSIKIYQRKKDSNSRAQFEMNYRVKEPENLKVSHSVLREKTKEVQPVPNLEKTIDTLLLQRYVPACVLVDEDLDILQFRGSTGLFLEPSPGKASLNLLKMARTGLNFELRTAIHKANHNGANFRKAGIEIKYKNNIYLVDIEVVPIKTEQDERNYLIVFEEQKVVAVNASSLSRDKRIKQLEHELLASKEDMRSIVEEQEAVNEELQSANEEIVSTNEELQSINEELETSKEEVESTNEELMTINQEMQIRNDQLAESYEYAEAIISTIRESAIILDNDLRVKTANRSFFKTFHLKEEDVEGRVIYELGNGKWNIPKLRELLEDIIPNNPQYYSFEVQHTFRGIGEKFLVINAKKIPQRINKQPLILLAIEDITQYVLVQKEISKREAKIHMILQEIPYGVWMADSAGKIIFRNKAYAKSSGLTTEDWDIRSGLHPEHQDKIGLLWDDHIISGEHFEEQALCKHVSDDTYRWHLITAIPIRDSDDKITSWVGTNVDIHEQKLFTEKLETRVKQRTNALEDAYSDLEKTNFELEQFAYIASHDLQEPLRKIQTFIDLMHRNIHNKEEVDKYYNKTISSAKRMSDLITDVLNFSKLNKRTQKPETVDLNKIISQINNDFEFTISKRGGKIHFEKLPIIDGFPNQLIRLFSNIISNALKFTEKEPVIKIYSSSVNKKKLKNFDFKPDKKYIEVIIEDNGIGFDQQYAEKIFTMFQRLHENSKYSGTGIGLSICKKIAENHNGTIYAESILGKGSAFHIVFPTVQ
jgi:two-component system CheB/CheR fusion protein